MNYEEAVKCKLCGEKFKLDDIGGAIVTNADPPLFWFVHLKCALKKLKETEQ